MPTNESEYKTMVQHWKTVGDSCLNMTGPLLHHLDTFTVVKDLDLVRQAIGDDKLNWIGLSYGTQIGLTYAEAFPDKVGSLVLDGVVDHSQGAAYLLQTESTTYDATLKQFFKWCKTDSSCALRNETDIQGFYKDLIAKAEKSPLPAPSCNSTGGSACQSSVTAEKLIDNIQEILINVKSPVASQPGWANLSQTLLSASQGDAQPLSPKLYTSDTAPQPDRMELAVGCQDFPRVTSYSELRGLLRMSHAISPLTKGYTQSLRDLAHCAAWPTKQINPPRPFFSSIKKAPKMLLVNSFWDPETNIHWAEAITGQLMNNTNLVYRNGSGHTSCLLLGETTAAVNAFLLNGTMPADGTVYQS